jgi:hypothetical protein
MKQLVLALDRSEMARSFAYFTNDNQTDRNSLSKSLGTFKKYFAHAHVALLSRSILHRSNYWAIPVGIRAITRG